MKTLSAASNVESVLIHLPDLTHQIEERKLKVTEMEIAFITGLSVNVTHTNYNLWFPILLFVLDIGDKRDQVSVDHQPT